MDPDCQWHGPGTFGRSPQCSDDLIYAVRGKDEFRGHERRALGFWRLAGSRETRATPNGNGNEASENKPTDPWHNHKTMEPDLEKAENGSTSRTVNPSRHLGPRERSTRD